MDRRNYHRRLQRECWPVYQDDGDRGDGSGRVKVHTPQDGDQERIVVQLHRPNQLHLGGENRPFTVIPDGASELEAMRAVFNAPTGSTYIKRVGGTYELFQQTDELPRWWRIVLRDNGGLYYLEESDIVTLVNGPTPATSTGINTSVTVTPIDRAWEYAWEMTDATPSTFFVGNVHGHETQVSLSIAVDGVGTTLSDGEVASGDVITITRVSKLTHTGPVDAANVTTVYTLTDAGLQVDHTTTWLGNYTHERGYAAMFPMANITDWCRGDLSVADEGTNNNDDSELLTDQHTMVAAWDGNGGYAMAGAMELLDLNGVNNWARADPQYFWVQDRTGSGSTNKMYATRQSGGDATKETVSNGTVWTSSALYRAGWVDTTQLSTGA